MNKKIKTEPYPSTSKDKTPYKTTTLTTESDIATKVAKSLQDLETEAYFDEDESDSEVETKLDVVSETEFSDSDEESDTLLELPFISPTADTKLISPDTFYGKNNYKWFSKEPNERKSVSPPHNIVTRLPGLREPAKALGEKPECDEVWNLIFDEDILNEIVIWTNVKLKEIREKHVKSAGTDYSDLNISELKAFLGLLLLISIFKSDREDLSSLFSSSTKGRQIFRATMSLNRFSVLATHLRFDDPVTRNERIITDKAAAISNMFNRIIENSQKCFSPSKYMCVDRMFVPFRGNCKFKTYIPSKPANYGLKLMCLADASNSYLYNAYIYLGKNSDGIELGKEVRNTFQKPTLSVLRLTKPVENTNRNITADNWFSSLDLINKLKQSGLTYVGALKQNKSEIPNEFLSDRKKEVGSSMYGFSEDITLLSYVPRKNKSIILISSLPDSKRNDTKTGLPDLINFYNKTKSAVDKLDMKCSNYSCNRRSKRWTMAIFYRLVNICVNNSFILYIHYKDTPTKTRFKFIDDLGTLLLQDHLRSRMSKKSLPRELHAAIQATLVHIPNKIELSLPLEDDDDSDKLEYRTTSDEKNKPTKRRLSLSLQDDDPPCDKLEKRTTCSICPYQKKRKTSSKCIICEKPICLSCSRKLCINCVECL